MNNYYTAPAAPMGLHDGNVQGYGAFGPQAPQMMMASKPQAGAFLRGQRRRMNFVPILLSVVVPWILFCALFAIMSFSLHYQQPPIAYMLCTLGFLVVAGLGIYAFNEVRRKDDPRREPSWSVFVFIACLLAWFLGVACGDVNFFNNMQPYYDVMNLNAYPSVDPSRMRGQQLMDAGRIVFAEGSRLDLSKSMGFKNLDLYCVAPVTIAGANSTTAKLANYDFWAVGVNCCSGSSADFHCGEFRNPLAHAGLRLMRDDQRAFFRLAVQQAEAAYDIRAVHPLFLYWMQDPIGEVNAYQDDGYKYYMLGVFSYLAFQLFLTVVATVLFSKLGQL